jgi:putative membrane protein
MLKHVLKTIILGGSALAVSGASAWAEQSYGAGDCPWGPHMMGWGGGWSGMVLGPLFMIVLLAVVIALAVFLVRWLGGQGPGSAAPQSAPGRDPLDILKERFARGEIGKDEFEERRRVLGG